MRISPSKRPVHRDTTSILVGVKFVSQWVVREPPGSTFPPVGWVVKARSAITSASGARARAVAGTRLKHMMHTSRRLRMRCRIRFMSPSSILCKIKIRCSTLSLCGVFFLLLS